MPRFEPKGSGWFFEVERDGLVVRTCVGGIGTKKISEKTHDTEDAARFSYGTQVARHLSMGLALVGTAQHLPVVAAPAAGSAVLVDEHFAAADDRFLAELLGVFAGGKLAALAERWWADKRPWARRMLLAYIADGCDRPEHKGLVKRLFKHAEKAADDEAMAYFLVAFDGLGRRVLVKPYRRSPEQVLRNDPLVPERLTRHGKLVRTSPQFSRATRRYLARRTYRYFRRIGHSDLPRYGRGLRIALARYRDEALDTPARLLDAWGLMHALYARSPMITREPAGIRLAKGASLGQLVPAPQFPDAWRGFAELVELLVSAQSRTVRTWTIAWLRGHHAAELATLTFAQVKPMVTSAHEELQHLGAELLRTLRGLETLPITEWLELLAIDNLDIAETVCEVVARHVTPVRLTLAQCVSLACAKVAPVARLGLTWARAKKIDGVKDLGEISKLVKAGVASVRAEGTAWASATITAHPQATPEHLRDLCDAPHADAREQALAVVATTAKLATPGLWFALTESPYDDVRTVVLRNAKRWRDEAPKATLQHVWSSAMLAVHRGSTTKRRVPRAIAERIAAHPDEAAELLPILGLALRSVRPPERATALAALTRAVHANSELRALAHAIIPELTVTELVTS